MDDEKFYAFREGVGKWIQLADGLGELIPAITCADNFTDERDGKTYGIVKIGDQCWMSENLNVGVKISAPATASNNMIIEKYCYNDLDSNCDTYGGLYQWDEMMQYSTTEGSQGICPEGWHLPTDNELCMLASIIDPSASICGGGGANNTVGGKMKQMGFTTWNQPNVGATNTSGFTALPAGAYEGNQFIRLGEEAYIWSSQGVAPISPVPIYHLTFDDDNYVTELGEKRWSYSVRCVQDSN